MNDLASDILPNPEQSELKAELDDVAGDEAPVTPERIDPRAELDDVADYETPVTPERIEPKSGSKKSSFSGETSSSNQRVKVRARYLDTSLGSCHDFCKYGHKNIMESTASFITKRKKKLSANSIISTTSDRSDKKLKVKKSAFPPENSTITRESSNLTASDKKSDKKLKIKKSAFPSENSTITRESSNLTASDKKSDKKLKVKKSSFLPENSNSTATRESSISTVIDNESDKKLKVKKNSLSPANSTIRRASSISSTSSKSNKKLNDVTSTTSSLSKGKRKELVQPNATLSIKTLIKRESKGKSENIKDLKEVSHLRKLSISVGKGEKKQSLDEKASEKKMGGDGNEMQNDEQMCFENKKGKQKSTVSVPTRSSLISRNRNLSLKRNQVDLSKSIKKVDRILSSEGSSTKMKKLIPKEKVDRISSTWPKRVFKKVGLQEKTDSDHKLAFKRGKVLDVKPNNTAPRRLKFKPRKVLPEDPSSKAGDDVASSKTQSVRQMTNPKFGIGTRLKRVGLKKVGIEEKSEKSVHKLDFERGKAVDTVPRRLKFKPRKVIVENANVDKSRRNLKNILGADVAKGMDNNEHLRVVLKHQDVEGKKDVQNLLNNVIEETATRLVRLRKSKVKALVGAFESLMSLPDAKSSTASTS